MNTLELTTEEIKDIREAIIARQCNLALDLRYADAVEASKLLTERARYDKLFAKVAVYP